MRWIIIINNLQYSLSSGDNKDKLSTEIKKTLSTAKKIKIISGFLTKSGFEGIFGRDGLDKRNYGKIIDYIIVGKLTVKCAELFDELIEYPEYTKKIFVNLGIGRQSKANSNKINKFLPMIHSKIIAINPDGDNNYFYIGSANITEFGLEDRNAEAGVILKDLSQNQRDRISEYMDKIKNYQSTVKYNPKLKNDLLFLTSLSTSDEDVYFKTQFEKIDKFLLVLCLNKNDYIPNVGDVIYGDLLRNLPKEIIKFHEKRGNIIVFLMFKDALELIKMNFNEAKIFYGKIENFNSQEDVNRSIEENIDALIDYSHFFIPIIQPMKLAPRIGPYNSILQTKYKIIDSNNEIINNISKHLNNTSNFEKLINRLIIEWRKTSQEFKPTERPPIRIADGIYFELAEFKRKSSYKTLIEVKNEYQEINTNTLGYLDSRISNILKSFNIKNFNVEYHEFIKNKMNEVLNEIDNYNLKNLKNQKFFFKAMKLIKITHK